MIKKISSFIILPLLLLSLISPHLFATTRGIRVVAKTGQSLYLYKNYHALVVGVSDYEKWPRLPNAVNDAKEVASKLKELGFEVKLVLDPTSREMKTVLNEMVYKMGTEENRALLFYYAGHGETEILADKTKMGYIIPKDCPLLDKDPMGFATHAISMRDIESVSMRIKSKHVLMLFDSCFSGSLFALVRAVPDDITEKSALPVRQYITAGREDEQVPDKSMFKRCFLLGLEGDADLTGDGYITGSELGMYLSDKVVNYTHRRQHPQYGKINNPDLDRGDFIFALKTPSRPSPPASEAPPPSFDAEKQRLAEERARLERERQELEQLKMEIERKKLEAEWKRLEAEKEKLAISKRPPKAEPKRTFTNSIGMKFVLIPEGTFMMGSPSDEPGRQNDERQHRVTLSEGFYIQTTQVTQGQWRSIMGRNPSHFKRCGDNCPVEKVSWNDCQGFIRKLNQKEGTNKYRLPTEAEWEYACRAGSTTAFANGGITELKCAYDPNLDAMGWYCGNSRKKPHPVGQKKPNAWGLYDMHGNVLECCQDWYEKNYPTGHVTDPKGPSSGAGRVLRGGGWGYGGVSCRSADRYGYNPGRRSTRVGFRVARDF